MPQRHVDSPNALNRREFLARATTALAFATKIAFGATSATSRSDHEARARYAVFHSLAPGDVKPHGWLRFYLQKQASQLGRRLPETSWPFTGAFWAGEESPPDASGIGWWPWEQKGYWIDGALRCALTLRDETLVDLASAPLAYTLNHCAADGYLGPAFAKNAEVNNPARANFRWPHTVFFRALAAHGEATKDPRVAAAMRRHYLADRSRVVYGGPSRDVTNIEGILWAYERTGDAELLALAETAWKDFVVSAPRASTPAGTYILIAFLPIHPLMLTGSPTSKRQNCQPSCTCTRVIRTTCASRSRLRNASSATTC